MATDLGNVPPTSTTVTLPSGVSYTLNITDAAVSTRTDMLTLHHESTGTLTSGVGGFGNGIRFEGEKADGAVVDMATIEGGWADPDATNPYGQLKFYCRRYGVANTLSLQIKPDNIQWPTGSVANPGAAFLANPTYGFAVTNRLAMCAGGVSRFGANDTGVCFNAVTTPIAAPSVAAALTNNIGAAGSSTLADWTSLTVYATDAAAIKAAVYQAVLKITAFETAMRAYGLWVT